MIRLETMKTDFKARRLHESSELRLSRLEKARSVRQTNRLAGSTTDSIKRFRDSIKLGPYFVCVICNRMLYRVRVTKCRTEKYPTVIQHIFTDVKSYDDAQYICHTCHVKAMKGKVPCQAVSNKMELYAVPMQIKCLRKLESVLVSQRIMFEKIVVMPKGKQRKIYGTVCNIPVNGDTVCQSLPRPPESSGIIMLKLKKELKYHGHQYYESVRPAIVYDALDYLRNNNTLCSNIDIVMTNIDNELVSFENPQELPADTDKSHDDEKLPTKVCNLHENKELSTEVGSSPEDDGQVHSSVGNQQYKEDSISINKSTKTHVLSSNSKQIDSGDGENIDQVDSDEEEIEYPQNMFRTNTNETCLQPWLQDYPLDIEQLKFHALKPLSQIWMDHSHQVQEMRYFQQLQEKVNTLCIS